MTKTFVFHRNDEVREYFLKCARHVRFTWTYLMDYKQLTWL